MNMVLRELSITDKIALQRHCRKKILSIADPDKRKVFERAYELIESNLYIITANLT